MQRNLLRLAFISLVIFVLSCGKSTESDVDLNSSGSNGSGTGSGTSSGGCGTYNGHTLHKGSDGGCYYINSSGNKTYVERNKCNC